ncbi:MAG: zinc-dependent dehydrogenase [Clostridium sp.]|nr:zinc-dependent dehydrogenase [Clostridium sp.]
MRAARMYGAGDIRLEECAKPEIGPGEILLKVKAAAICGTDLRMIQNGVSHIDREHPRILGHEISGVIERTGERVAGYSEGMHICLAPNMGCGICDHCVDGDTHLCGDYQAFGINIDGGFAEYVRIPAEAVRQGNLMVIDEKVDFGEAALLEPASCVMNGQSRVGIHLNDTVLVVGAGPIGLMHALLAKACGAAKVYMRDLSEERLKQCAEVDKDFIPLYGQNLKEQIFDLTNGRGVNVCIVACPSGQAQAESLELMAMNGRILFFGGLPQEKDIVSLPSNLIHYRQLMICGSTRANISQYRSIAKMVENGHLDLKKIISRRYPLEEIEEAIAYAKSAKGLKTVIQFE